MNSLLFLANVPPPVTGRITGGWEFVWAAYLITWGAVATYAVTLWLRSRRSPAGDKETQS